MTGLVSRLKLGVVFQGPLISVGRSGKSLEGNVGDDWVEFDARPSLNRMFGALSKLGIPSVLGTWEGQPTDGLEMPAVMQKLPVELFGKYSEPSKFYQIASFKAGLDYLASVSDLTHVVKVRADVELNVFDLCTSLNEVFLDDSVAIAIPYIDTGKAWSIQDFYWAGGLELMKRISEECLIGPEVHKHVHQDFFWRFSSIALDEWNRAVFCRYGRPWTKSQWEEAVSRTLVLRPMSREIWSSLIWRGYDVESGAFSVGSDARNFQGETKVLRPPKLMRDCWLTDMIFTDNLSESRNLEFRNPNEINRLLKFIAGAEKALEPFVESPAVKTIAIQMKDKIFIRKSGL